MGWWRANNSFSKGFRHHLASAGDLLVYSQLIMSSILSVEVVAIQFGREQRCHVPSVLLWS